MELGVLHARLSGERPRVYCQQQLARRADRRCRARAGGPAAIALGQRQLAFQRV